jgi:hypothetical protein
MDTIVAVSTAWTIGSRAVELLKGAAEQAKPLGKSEIISSLIDVQVAMMQVLAEQQKLVDENRSLRDRVRELQDTIETKQKLEFHHNTYWTRNEDSSLDGPFSSQEWDYSKRLVRVADYGSDQYSGVWKVRFYDARNNQEFYIPLSFLKSERVMVMDKIPTLSYLFPLR